jgi:hypothetical protein
MNLSNIEGQVFPFALPHHSSEYKKACPIGHIIHDGYDLESIPSQSLFFVRTKQSNQKKVRPYYCSKTYKKTKKHGRLHVLPAHKT